MLVALALSSAGCGGVNARGTVSPAMFLMKAGPPPATGQPISSPEPVKELAQAD